METYGTVDDFDIKEHGVYWILKFKNVMQASLNFFKANDEYIVEKVPKKNEFIIYDEGITEEDLVDKFDPEDYEKRVKTYSYEITFRDKHEAQLVIDTLDGTRLGKYKIRVTKI